MRKQMHKEVSYNEKVRQEKLIQEAFIDEINKDGAPFLNEMQANSNALEEKRMTVNKLQGQ